MRFQVIGDGTFRRKILLDGYDASSALQGFTYRSDVYGRPDTVELDLVVLHEATVEVEAVVLVPAAVVELLTRFGWTPPEGAQVRGGAMRLTSPSEPRPTLLDQLPREEGKSLGERPHDSVGCHMMGAPHLGPCVDTRTMQDGSCSCLAPDAWDPYCPLHGDMADRTR